MVKISKCVWSAHGSNHRISTIAVGDSDRIAEKHGGIIKSRKNVLLAMKLTFMLLTAGFLNVAARGVSQNISFSRNNVPLETVFSSVEKQTGFVFMYTKDVIRSSRPVSISAQNLSLEKFLDEVFKSQASLIYDIRGKSIFITPKVPVELFSDDHDKSPRLPEFIPFVPLRAQVLDEDGQPLVGASVTVKNSPVSAVTDAQGFVNLNVNEGDILVVTYVGYQSKEIKVKSGMLSHDKSFSITLSKSASNLEEVAVTVNTGYQRIRPEQSTGAVAQISTKQYESRISTNFLDGLANRLPGLMINNDVTFTSNGTSRPLFNIRGISTMSANQNPLIVVDGYPTELTLDMIDPNEIRSVTVLKDAAAATVYGVRASNGVIVIERKQASIGKPRFTFRATAGVTPREDYSRYRWDDDASAIVSNYQRTLALGGINASTWGLLATPTSVRGGTIRRDKTYYIQAQAAANMITPGQAAEAFSEIENYNNADDYSRLFQRSAVTQTYNFNVSGGNDNALYYVTANYTGNRLANIENSDSRFLLSARSTLKFSRRLSLELTTDYQERFDNAAPVPGITSIAPYERFQDVNGNPDFIFGAGISPWYNDVIVSQGLYNELYYPLIDVKEIDDKTHTVNNRVTANFRYNIANGFDLSFRGIYETSRSNFEHHASELSSEARDYINSYVIRNTDGTLDFKIPKGGFLRQEAASTYSYTARAQLNYDKKINRLHSINGILGAEVRKLVEKTNLSSYFGYNNETLLQQPVDYSSIVTGAYRGSFLLGSPLQGLSSYNNLFNQQYVEDRFLSGYANIVYSFKNTYSLSGSIRVDQSNLFGTNPKYKYKPLWSAGAAWNIHNESFMQGVDWVKLLKLRLAYGFNGNVAKMSLPQVIAQSFINTYTSPASPSLKLLSYANSSLRWEQTQNFNVGFDYKIMRSISGSIDYYRKKSSDLLGNSLIDPTIGISPSLINQATIQNNGVELALNADWITTKKFNWNMGLVVARNTSKVLEVYRRGDYDPQTLQTLGYVKGFSVGAMFAYRYAGLDTAGYALVETPAGKLLRTNDNRSPNTTFALMRSDTSGLTVYMGSSIPTVNAGLSNRVDIGNFYVFCMINYYGGFKVRVPRPNPSSSRPLEGAGTYWKAKGDQETTDVMGLAAYSSRNSNDAYNYADKYVVNGDYITLADLTVSYSLDNLNFIRRAGFSHFEVKAQASNLWTIGLNDYNYSMATGSFQKTYVTPTYTLGIFSNF